MAVKMGTLITVIMGLIIATIMTSVGAEVLGNLRSGQVVNSYEYNITGEGLKGLDEISSWFDLIGLVAAAVFVIGLVVGGFGEVGGAGARPVTGL